MKKYSRKLKLKTKLYMNLLVLLLVVLSAFGIYQIFFAPSAYSNFVEDEVLWDGKSIATSFAGGNGTKENPYRISSGAELLYFANWVNTGKAEPGLYYLLTANLNMGDFSLTPIGNETAHFAGTFDGQGYRISHWRQTEGVTSGKRELYGLFSEIENAVIENLNLESIEIVPNVHEKEVHLGLLAAQMTTSHIRNISANNVTLEGKNLTSEHSQVGGLVGMLASGSIQNSYSNIKMTQGKGNYGTVIGSGTSEEANALAHIVQVGNSNLEIAGKFTGTIDKETIWTVENGHYKNLLGTIEEKSHVLSQYQQGTTYLWYDDAGAWKIKNVLLEKKYQRTKMVKLFNLVEHPSGIEGSTVYVNDLESDWNHYLGQNYTDSKDGKLPSGENQHLFGEENLVKVQLTYSGTETLANGKKLTGTVSTTELQDTYIYYKIYPVQKSGTQSYIEIELIDNPFSNHPLDRAFNNWVTAYPNAEIRFDADDYSRYLKVPVTFTDGLPNEIEIEVSAKWVYATVSRMSASENWNNAMANLKSAGMEPIELVHTYYDPFDMTGYFYQVSLSFWESYDGYYDEYGEYQSNGTCYNWGGCTMYERIDGEMYQPENTYYMLRNGRMVEVREQDLPLVSHTEINEQYIDANMAGYYRSVNLTRNQSLAGYYNSAGVLQQSGTCTSSNCTYYQLLQYYDAAGRENIVDESVQYYYLVTRDTNLIFLDQNISNAWSNQTKPFTLTSVFNGEDRRASVTWNISSAYVRCQADTVIENIKITSNQSSANTNPGSGTSTRRYLYGMWNNVKLGRGLQQVGNYKNFAVVIGGGNNSTGNSNSSTKYKLMIESGTYNSLALSQGTVGTSYTDYIAARGIYGNDYDRVNNNNRDLDIYYCASGSWGGRIYTSSEREIALDLTVKSGSFGTGKYDHTTGIYVGGRYGGTHYDARKITYEGGYTYNLIGGPLTDSSRSSYNDTYMYIKGGEIDMITGGAGTTATYGNRIVQATGGVINYSIFGGSNGYDGSSSDGTLIGTSYVYVGGNVTVGNRALIDQNRTLFGSEAGSVFGIGNGRSGYTQIGSSNHSMIIVDGQAHVLGNVYGGGNYGATGISSNENKTTTKIDIHGGQVEGSVYGGGNQNGSGSTNKVSTVTITMTDGNVGNIYGGSNEQGTIYGDVYLKVLGGTITQDIYGGGKGGYASSNDRGTYVSGKVEVEIGGTAKESPLIIGNVYGGSAYGTVNATSNTTSSSSNPTSVTIKNGVVQTSVFGGGKGSNSYTPYVAGNIKVTVMGGNIGNVFGGNDAAGVPNGMVEVLVQGGKVGNVFGGGNSSSVRLPKVMIEGGTITNLFGGSNETGNVTSSEIKVTGGVLETVYGGNNLGGTTQTTYVSVYSGTIQKQIYGGGKLTDCEETNLYFHGSTEELPEIYGGGESASVTTTHVNFYRGTANAIYGGSNKAGTVKTALVYIESGTVQHIYGGNNIGGTTEKTSLDVRAGNFGKLYGGGNEAKTMQNELTMTGGTFEEIYGGGNKAETTQNTILSLKNIRAGSIYAGGNLGNVNGNTTLTVVDSIIEKDVYGGGNAADVLGNAVTNVAGSTAIGKSLFGGGNAGAIGIEAKDNSKATVNVTGATIAGNVYGGGNTSVVYGTTEVNIGRVTVSDKTLPLGNIQITGTVFGGGEANAEGSEIYDYSFICVTVAIHIHIDGEGYLSSGKTFMLSGSIFGSGNASSSKGTSDIYIANLGTKDNPSRNISIQRSDQVTIDHSYLEFSGTTDRTNEYSTIKYSFNRIDLLKIKNNTTLLLKQNANLLKRLESVVDKNGKEEKATVAINDDTKQVTKNVDNRIYLVANKNLNVATNEAATSYGVVSGMTFFGMYTSYANGSIAYGLYDSDLSYGDRADAGDVIIGGSYVLGLHSLDHDITKDGFYTNYIDDAYTEVTTAYIEPTPPTATYYMWTIGTQAINYSFNLNASKYSSLGTYELSLLDFAKGNTTFEVIGFNSEGLTGGVVLKDANEVPKIAKTAEEANRTLGLSMKSETTEWTLYGTTKFLSTGKGTYTGTTSYKTDNVSKAPSLMFYLYHAKNISLDADLGTVVITLQALTPRNEIEFDTQLITISIELSARSYDDGDFYDSSITYDKKYEMPSTTSVNITNRSQFTAYFSLYAPSESLEKFYGIGNRYYHVLTSNFALPVGTSITMLDYGVDDETPEYYTYTVDDAGYQRALNQLATENEVTYRLSDFIKMATTSSTNRYQDAVHNQSYYHSELGLVMEEFLFIFDFKDTKIAGDHPENTILFELRNQDDRAVITVLGIRQNLMKYSMYEVSNVALKETASLDSPYVYHEQDVNLNYRANVTYDQNQNRDSIIDTNYESSSMGLNVSLFDSAGNPVSSSMLNGTLLKVAGTAYHADSDGVYRVKLANKVSNLSPPVFFYVGNTLHPGVYKMRLTLFASDDGLHNSGTLADDTIELSFTVVGNNNLIKVESESKNKLIDGVTGLNELGTREEKFRVIYESELIQPNLRISLYRRNTDTVATTEYTLVDIRKVFANTFTFPSSVGFVGSDPLEFFLSKDLERDNEFIFSLREQLESGTYKIVFRLYDQNHKIDEDVDYLIIKKPS